MEPRLSKCEILDYYEYEMSAKRKLYILFWFEVVDDSLYSQEFSSRVQVGRSARVIIRQRLLGRSFSDASSKSFHEVDV